MLPAYRHILFASDLSDVAHHAMGHALSLARAHGARLTLLHVLPDLLTELSQGVGINVADFLGEPDLQHWRESEQDDAVAGVRGRLSQICQEHMREEGLCGDNVPQLDVLVDMGDPEEAILTRLREGTYDCLVVGSHGRDMVSRLLLGSVTEGVVRGSPVPVLVAPLPHR